jgi:hypothetical protein
MVPYFNSHISTKYQPNMVRSIRLGKFHTPHNGSTTYASELSAG